MTDRVMNRLQSYQMRIERSTMLFEKTFIGVGNRFQSAASGLSRSFDGFRLKLVATREHIERRERANEQRYRLTLERVTSRLSTLTRVLDSVSPVRVLERGYAIARNAQGIVLDPTVLAPGERLSLQFAKGKVETEVIGRRKQEKLL